MGKKFQKLDPHGMHGSFYRDSTSGNVFRADSPKIAAQIAFNDWLAGFDNVLHSADNVVIGDGFFTVDVNTHSHDGLITSCKTIRRDIVYHGPENMFAGRNLFREQCDARMKENAT